MAQSPCTGLLFFHLQIYTHATIVHVHAYAPPPSLSLPSLPQVAPSIVSSHTSISFNSEDPALLCRYPMPFGLKPAQLNWQREVTYGDRGNIIDMIKLDPAKFPSRR